jgi:DNA-binding response OmpR family regulator
MKKVLIVEDDQLIFSILSRELADAGFEVSNAFDGEQAVDVTREQKPDLVLLDILLPRKNGFEVLQSLKADSELSSIPVVILSNLGQPEDIQKGRELGAIDYMVKVEFEPKQIVSKVRTLLAA